MKPIHESLQKTIDQFESGSQQSFLFDLQSVVFSSFGRNVKVVVGSTSEDLCLAHSAMHAIEHDSPSDNWAVLEVFDSFFCSLKHTAVCPAHLAIEFEGDVNLMDARSEVPLGPS